MTGAAVVVAALVIAWLVAGCARHRREADEQWRHVAAPALGLAQTPDEWPTSRLAAAARTHNEGRRS